MNKTRMLEQKAWVWQVMYQWLGAMSSSRFKPFRHSATFIANTIQCSLCDFLNDTTNDLNVAELQLGSCTGQEQKKLLENKILDLNACKKELESWTDNFFEGIFIHRCRDSDPLIRAECGIQICSWMSRLKEKYMDPQYLRYVGWMLADKVFYLFPNR
jgi:cohesin complex subunit SA-1/2